jgi:hypothetical protein
MGAAMRMKRIKPRKRCCKSRPRCKRCPVVCKRLEAQGLATREGKHYLVSLDIKKKTLKAARA